MKRFKNILLVYDNTESGQLTLGRVIDLAKQNGARLTVVHVIDQIPQDYRMLITTIDTEEIMKLVTMEHTQILEKAVARFPETSDIQCKVITGREFIEIIKEVLRNRHDLVIKTARGMGGMLGMLFGATAMHLLRKCPCPVWLIKPGQVHFHRVMAAVDLVPLESHGTALNRKILELASSLTSMDKGKLLTVNGWNWTLPETQISTAEDPVIILSRIKEMHLGWMDDLLGQFDLQQLPHQEFVVQGKTDEIIAEITEQHHVDIVVMGTVCRTGIPGFFIGNTAEKILYRIDSSVLAVKPEGFVSPVTLD